MAPTHHSNKTSNGSRKREAKDSSDSTSLKNEKVKATKIGRKIKSKKVETHINLNDDTTIITGKQLRNRNYQEASDSDSNKLMSGLPLNHSKYELRCVMRFLCALGVSPSEIDRQLSLVYGKALSRGVVFRWCQQFRNGRDTLEDHKRSGRPKNLKVNDCSDDILAYVKNNRHAKLRQISFQMRLPASTMFNYIKDTLKYKLVLGCWVPIQLSEENKEERLKFSVSNLARCKSESLLTFTNRIVVADQTWVHFHTTPLNKRLPPMKNDQGEIVKRKKKVRQKWTLETGPSPSINSMMTVFWDCTGVVAIDFKEQDVDSDSNVSYRYSDKATLEMLYEQICTKRPGLLITGLTLLMNEDLNEEEKRVVDQSGDTITSRLNMLGWQGLFNPRNSPDLSPSDYYLFQPLKKHVSGKRFLDADAGKRCVLEWFWAQEPEFFSMGVQDLASRWEKCVKTKGDYLDK